MPEYTLFPSLIDSGDDATARDSVELAFANDTCPWCGDSYANVKAHASQAHESEWSEWKNTEPDGGA